MAGGEALQLALALHRQPALNAECRTQQLPSDIIEVLRIAAGHAEVISAAVAATQSSADELREVARFFVEQQLLSRESESDPWRVLGVQPGTDANQIREHRRLLVGLVHPDRSNDWEAAYADRVNRAWRLLKSPASREAIETQQAAASGSDMASRSSAVDDWDAEVATRGYVPSLVDVEAPSADAGRPLAEPPRHRSAVLGASALAAVVALAVGWGIFSDGMSGDEVLVPMAEPTPGALTTAPNSKDAQRAASSSTQVSVVAADVAEELKGPRLATQIGAAEPADSRSSVAPDEMAVEIVPEPPLAANIVVVADAGPAEVSRLPAAVQPAASEPDVSEGVRAPRSRGSSGAVAIDRVQPASIAAASPDLDADESFNSIQVTADAMLNQPPPLPAVRPTQAAGVDDRPARPKVSKVPALALQQEPAISRSAPVANGSVVGTTAKQREMAPMPKAAQAMPAAEPVVAAVPPAPVRVVDSVVSPNAAVERLLATFSSTYARGDLNGLVALFSRRANSANGGSLALAADYARLFDTTSERSIVVRGLAWREEGDTLRGQGSFEARYRKQGRLFKQVVGGTLQFVMVEEAGQLRLLRLDSSSASSNL